MAKLIFGIPHRDVTRELRNRGCLIVRNNDSREIWKTPMGKTISITSHREISSADAMRMNQALSAEGLVEIRPPVNNSKPAIEASTQRQAPEQPAPAPEPKPAEPVPLRQIFYRRLLAAKRRRLAV